MKCVQTISFDIRGELEISEFEILRVDCNFLYYSILRIVARCSNGGSRQKNSLEYL